MQAVYTAAFILHIAELLISPPARLPVIFPVLNVLISTPVFALVWLWSIKRGVEVSWALGGLGSRSKATHKQASSSSKLPQTPIEGLDGQTHGNAPETILPRASGMRTMRLGYAQAKRRKGPRSGSVDIRS